MVISTTVYYWSSYDSETCTWTELQEADFPVLVAHMEDDTIMRLDCVEILPFWMTISTTGAVLSGRIPGFDTETCFSSIRETDGSVLITAKTVTDGCERMCCFSVKDGYERMCCLV